MLDDVLVCITVSGLRTCALAKMDLARLGPHKDGGVEHHIFSQAFATRGPPLRHLAITSTDIMSGVGVPPPAIPGQAAVGEVEPGEVVGDAAGLAGACLGLERFTRSTVL